jgi:ABC-type lipoprotein release transport system permease subunit
LTDLRLAGQHHGMLFMLALRNVAKTWSKRLTFGIFFAATMALLFVGNTLFENSDRGLAATYVSSFTGQGSVSASSPDSFTIFGSDLPLIGQYLVIPLLPDADKLRQKITQILPNAYVVRQVTAAAKLEIGDYSEGVPVFGVEFRPYFDAFPALHLKSGSLPDASQPTILLTTGQADRIQERLHRPVAVGDTLTLSFAINTSFVTRQVVVAGFFDYPASDALLDRIVLTDPDTARALDGYLYGQSEVKLDAKSKNLLSTGLDDLFSGSDYSGAASTNGLTPEELLKQVGTPVPAPVSSGVEGAWNFLVVRQSGVDDSTVMTALKKAVGDKPAQLRDWRETAGGTAQIAWFLRIIFNLGLLFIAVVSCLILVNSLSLSILERTKEIGTMRALGAERGFVGGLIAWETVLVVVGMGVTGIVVGALAVKAISTVHPHLSNVYLASLFGASELRLKLSWNSVIEHLALTLLLGLVSVVIPVRRAVSIQPVKAIAREQ